MQEIGTDVQLLETGTREALARYLSNKLGKIFSEQQKVINLSCQEIVQNLCDIVDKPGNPKINSAFSSNESLLDLINQLINLDGKNISGYVVGLWEKTEDDYKEQFDEMFWNPILKNNAYIPLQISETYIALMGYLEKKENVIRYLTEYKKEKGLKRLTKNSIKSAMHQEYRNISEFTESFKEMIKHDIILNLLHKLSISKMEFNGKDTKKIFNRFCDSICKIADVYAATIIKVSGKAMYI